MVESRSSTSPQLQGRHNLSLYVVLVYLPVIVILLRDLPITCLSPTDLVWLT